MRKANCQLIKDRRSGRENVGGRNRLNWALVWGMVWRHFVVSQLITFRPFHLWPRSSSAQSALPQTELPMITQGCVYIYIYIYRERERYSRYMLMTQTVIKLAVFRLSLGLQVVYLCFCCFNGYWFNVLIARAYNFIINMRGLLTRGGDYYYYYYYYY